MGEIRALEQEHQLAKATHEDAKHRWLSERRALEEVHSVTATNSQFRESLLSRLVADLRSRCLH